MSVQFDAELVEIRSRPDHSYDVRLNVPEYGMDAIRQMLTWVHDEVGVAVVNLSGVVTGGEHDGRERRQRAVGQGRKRKPGGA